MTNDGQVCLYRSVLAADSPASGATATLWASNTNGGNAAQGSRYKRIIVNIYSSHASAASGLQFDESEDGVTWDNLVSYTVAATTYTKSYVSMASAFLRVRYVQSANTITTWRVGVYGDQNERAAQ